MRVTFRQLQVFLAIAEKGSITAAARACHVTQPTVSMQLKDLTESVGLPLYEQLGKRLHLTVAGEALVKSARNMIDEWSSFEQEVAGLKGLTKGQLRLAVVSTAKYFVPRLLGRFSARHPEIDVALQVLNRDGVVARLRENRDDLYIMSMPPSDIDLQQRMFLPNPLVVIAPHTHRLAVQRSIPLARLASERFILREQGSGTRMACDAHFIAHGFQPSVRLELGSNEAIRQAVAAGLGLAVLSSHALGSNQGSDRVVILNVRGFPMQSSWFILFPNGKRLSPIATEFLTYLLQATTTHAARVETRR